jgi:hypothetical protein
MRPAWRQKDIFGNADLFPASSRRTDTFGFSERRLASTQPAVPAQESSKCLANRQTRAETSAYDDVAVSLAVESGEVGEREGRG